LPPGKTGLSNESTFGCFFYGLSLKPEAALQLLFVVAANGNNLSCTARIFFLCSLTLRCYRITLS